MTRLLINLTISSLFAASIAFLLIKLFRKDNVKPAEIWGTILIGLFAIFPASLVEVTITLYTTGITGILKNLFHAFVVAAFVEEIVKFLFIKLIFYIKKPESKQNNWPCHNSFAQGYFNTDRDKRDCATGRRFCFIGIVDVTNKKRQTGYGT